MTRGNPPWTSWSQWVYLPIETIRRCAMIRRFVDGHFCWWITIASVKLQSVSSSYLSIERVCFDHVKRLANKRDVYKFCHCLRKILVVKWALLLGGKSTTCHSRLSEAVLLKAMNATGIFSWWQTTSLLTLDMGEFYRSQNVCFSEVHSRLSQLGLWLSHGKAKLDRCTTYKKRT